MAIGNFLTVAEAAELVGVTRGRLYQLLRAGDLEGVRMQREWLVPRRAAKKLARQPQTTGRPRSGHPN